MLLKHLDQVRIGQKVGVEIEGELYEAIYKGCMRNSNGEYTYYIKLRKKIYKVHGDQILGVL